MNQQFEELQKFITNLEDQRLKKELSSVIDSFTGARLPEHLKEAFGDRNFKVKINSLFKPSLNRQGGEYKYYIEHVSWDGNPNPNPHQVFFFLKENYGAYLKSLDFDRRMFTRRLSNIRKRYISWYAILNINNAEFNAIEVDIKNVENKINDKVTISYFIVKSKDEKLGIETKGETLEDALVRLQSQLTCSM